VKPRSAACAVRDRWSALPAGVRTPLRLLAKGVLIYAAFILLLGAVLVAGGRP
jgi:hypothetical protein